MSVHSAPLDHRAYVSFAVLTHAVVRATAADDPQVGAVAAVLPDVDLLFPPGGRSCSSTGA